MSRFLSKASESLLPYTGRAATGRKFIKLNTNECLYPRARRLRRRFWRGMRENSSKIMPLELANLRLYSDPEERIPLLRRSPTTTAWNKPGHRGQWFRRDLGFAFRAFCDQNAPAVRRSTYGFYPALCGLYGIPFKVVPLEKILP